jgi:hypothetical protein
VSKIYKFQVGKRKLFIHTDTTYDVNMYTRGGGEEEGIRDNLFEGSN